jgi:predicted ArsR family transcriptional regulator
MPAPSHDTKLETAPGRILAQLKRQGPQCAERLAEAMGVTTMAVRQHLYALQAEGLVSFAEEARPRGRPLKLWSAQRKADGYFADAHASLSVELIETVRSVFGEEGLDRLIEARTERQLKDYGERLKSARTMRAKVQALAKLRTQEGYLAEAKPADDGRGFLILENHCPICEAARACTGLCRQELRLFRTVLGDEVKVEREDHILSGARRCAYRVTPKE